jgi:anti-sigma factor RsiW
MDARVEAYVDGALPEDEARRFESVLHDESYWKAQVRQARRIQDTLREVRTPPAPPALTQQIFQQTSRASQPSLSWWQRTMRQVVHSWRALGAARRHPAFDYAVGVAFVAMAAFFITMPLERGAQTPAQRATQLNVQTTAPYSPEEIRHAAESAQWTLTSLSELGSQATQSMRDQVYHVVGATPPPDTAAPELPGATDRDASPSNTSPSNTSPAEP